MFEACVKHYRKKSFKDYKNKLKKLAEATEAKYAEVSQHLNGNHLNAEAAAHVLAALKVIHKDQTSTSKWDKVQAMLDRLVNEVDSESEEKSKAKKNKIKGFPAWVDHKCLVRKVMTKEM